MTPDQITARANELRRLLKPRPPRIVHLLLLEAYAPVGTMCDRDPLEVETVLAASHQEPDGSTRISYILTKAQVLCEQCHAIANELRNPAP